MVQLRVVPEHTIRGAALAEKITHKLCESFIITCFLSDVIQTLIILNPEAYVPSLIIAPTVVGLGLKLGLEGGGHVCFSQHGQDIRSGSPLAYSVAGT